MLSGDQVSRNEESLVDAEDALRANMYAILAAVLRSPPDVATLGELADLRAEDGEIGVAVQELAAAARETTPEAVEDEYHEEVQAGENTSVSGDRATPGRVDDETIIELIEDAFARYDAVALGSAFGVVAGSEALGIGIVDQTIAIVVGAVATSRDSTSALDEEALRDPTVPVRNRDATVR